MKRKALGDSLPAASSRRSPRGPAYVIFGPPAFFGSRVNPFFSSLEVEASKTTTPVYWGMRKIDPNSVIHTCDICVNACERGPFASASGVYAVARPRLRRPLARKPGRLRGVVRGGVFGSLPSGRMLHQPPPAPDAVPPNASPLKPLTSRAGANGVLFYRAFTTLPFFFSSTKRKRNTKVKFCRPDAFERLPSSVVSTGRFRAGTAIFGPDRVVLTLPGAMIIVRTPAMNVEGGSDVSVFPGAVQ